MDWNKLFPESIGTLVSAIVVVVAGYSLIVDSTVDFLAFLIFAAVGTVCVVRTIKKLSSTS